MWLRKGRVAFSPGCRGQRGAFSCGKPMLRCTLGKSRTKLIKRGILVILRFSPGRNRFPVRMPESHHFLFHPDSVEEKWWRNWGGSSSLFPQSEWFFAMVTRSLLWGVTVELLPTELYVFDSGRTKAESHQCFRVRKQPDYRGIGRPGVRKTR